MKSAGKIIITWFLCLYLFFSLVLAEKCNKSGSLDSNRMNCTDNGEVVCMPGWSGKNCNIAQCQQGCHSKHGYCTQPGECKCALGWRGRNCDECVPLPGCKQGFCNSTSYECICNPGWEGTYCSIPVCREGCHSSRGYCKLPGECRCRIGWGGSTCELCRPLPGCKNGYCTKPLECKCRPGWIGMHCDIPICKANCSKEHGSCSKPGECRCDVGWWGENCETCFPYPGCKHGYCNKPWECICEEGWKGMKCDQKVEISKSYCHTHPNPCRNGGTCMDTDSDPEYKCACNPLFTGEHCDFLVNARPFYFPIFPRNSARSFTPVTSLVRAVEAQAPPEYEDPEPVEEIEIEEAEGKSLKEALEQPNTEQENEEDSKTEDTKIENSEVLPEDNVETVSEDLRADTTAMDKKQMQESEMTEPTVSENTETSSESIIKKEQKVETTTKRQIVVPIKQIKYEISTSSSLSISKPDGEKEKEKESKSIKSDTENISKSLIKIDKLNEESRNFEKNTKTKITTEKAILQSKQEYGRDKMPTKVTIRKKIAPVLFLELRSPTKPFQSTLEDDIENTDANSPQANQISKRARFLRHQESVGVPPFSRRISAPLPLPSQQQETPRPSRLRISRYSVNSVSSPAWEPIGQSSNIKSIVPARLTGSFHQRNIHGKGGPMREKGHFRTNIDPIKDFTSHEDHEAIQASDSFHTTGTVNRVQSDSYHVMNYNGRVHIGDTTEVEKNAPLEEILQAFIELKKIKR